jgi:hypothetical protein
MRERLRARYDQGLRLSRRREPPPEDAIEREPRRHFDALAGDAENPQICRGID